MKPTRDPLGTGGMDRTAIFAKLKKAWFLVLGLSALSSMLAWAYVGSVPAGDGFGIVWGTFVLILLNVVGTHVFGLFGTSGGGSDSALSVGWWLGAMMAGSFMSVLNTFEL